MKNVDSALEKWWFAWQATITLLEEQLDEQADADAAYFIWNGRFFATFSPKTGAFWVIFAEKSGHLMENRQRRGRLWRWCAAGAAGSGVECCENIDACRDSRARCSRYSILHLKMMDFALKNDGFCNRNDGFCIKNDESRQGIRCDTSGVIYKWWI